jgi:hypothetical protein
LLIRKGRIAEQKTDQQGEQGEKTNQIRKKINKNSRKGRIAQQKTYQQGEQGEKSSRTENRSTRRAEREE